MNSALSTSLTVTFGDGAEGSIVLEQGGDCPVKWGSTLVTMIDKVPGGDVPKLHTTVGTVEVLRAGVKKIQETFATLTGVDTYKLPNPKCTLTIIFFIEEDGSVKPVDIFADSYGRHAEYTVNDEGVVSFGRKVWGMIKVGEYDQPVTYLQYTPSTKGSNYTGSAGNNTGVAGFTTTYGVLAAYKRRVLATLEIAPGAFSDGNEELEVYRVESKVLVNTEGAWEYPPGWPESGEYPHGETPTPRPRIGVVTIRVHEVGLVSSYNGHLFVRKYFFSWQQPFFGDPTYKPVTEVVNGQGLEELRKLNESYYLRALEILDDRQILEKANSGYK